MILCSICGKEISGNEIYIYESRLHVTAETVEKLKKHDFKVYNYLILLHVKSGKMPKLGFFDSLAM